MKRETHTHTPKKPNTLRLKSKRRTCYLCSLSVSNSTHNTNNAKKEKMKKVDMKKHTHTDIRNIIKWKKNMKSQDKNKRLILHKAQQRIEEYTHDANKTRANKGDNNKKPTRIGTHAHTNE